MLRNKWQQKWIDLEVTHKTIQEAADASESFCGRWFRNNPHPGLLVLSGASGTGKSHIANAIFRFCIGAAMSSFDTKVWGESDVPQSAFIRWPEAADAFAEKHFGLMEDAISHSLTILDDIGAEQDPWNICKDKLCQILSRRENKFTVITTNILPAAWPERFDTRISDRLLRNSVVVDLSDVKSYAVIKSLE